MLKKIFALIIILLLSGPSLHADLMELQQKQNLADFKSYYKPIGEWAGQIILPSANRRLPGGSVPFLVFSSPRKELVGRILKLSWNRRVAEENWFDQMSVDVKFNPKAKAFGEKAGCRFPSILEGWKKVSPFESLAANRSENTIEVVLKNVVCNGSEIFTSEEPVQVNGAAYCLAKFVGKQEGSLRRIRHFNPATRRFDGPEEIVTIMPRKVAKGEDAPNTSVEDIENTGMNSGGWYMYGKKLRNTFLVKSLEPRLPLLVKPTVCISEPGQIKNYVRKEVFSGLRSGLYRTTYCADDQSESLSKQFPIGSRYLLIHLFGWRKIAGKKPGIMSILNLVTGHFAFGFAEVVRDKFTGEPRWDIEYKQVYGHNREEVVSGTMKWHAYMGNLRRGWMYSIPVADTIIDIPELQPYKINGKIIRPMRGLERELEQMMSKYRVGSGSGCSMVRPDVSCVQDSHCALYAGLDNLLRHLVPTSEFKTLRESSSPYGQRLNSLLTLAKDVERTIASFGNAQGNWKEFAAEPFGTRDPSKVKALLRTFISIRTVFPRAAHDNLLRLAAKKNYRMWNILTCQIGGKIPQLIPQKPTSLIGHK